MENTLKIRLARKFIQNHPTATKEECYCAGVDKMKYLFRDYVNRIIFGSPKCSFTEDEMSEINLIFDRWLETERGL